ncbi:hypothetical protein V1517DRAFT_329015 [Lipomyces orientalis]|uniref:Uncharacterized protein n=1 Tax=Lipomyces orientalis TaxID=1233043 RepID=A0ACC3TH71_9ASCO
MQLPETTEISPLATELDDSLVAPFTKIIPICMMDTRKVAVITGANGGLGFSIACRLLDTILPSVPLTIVITARYLRKAVETINRLRAYASSRDLLSFDYVLLDLSSISSIDEVAQQLLSRYTHIDYLFCNAGGGDFTGIDWPAAFVEILSGPKNAVTHPHFKRERIGRISRDSLGWVFQINVFANYFFVKQISTLLSGGGRVILISSIETEIAHTFDPDDVQLIHSDQPYVDSKKELELMHTAIAKRWAEELDVLIYITHPGICQTSIFAEYLNWFTTFGMLCLFYIARWIGSPWHVISPYKGALAPVWAAVDAVPDVDPVDGIVYASATDRWGRPFVKRTHNASTEDRKNGAILIEVMDKLVEDSLERIKMEDK